MGGPRAHQTVSGHDELGLHGALHHQVGSDEAKADGGRRRGEGGIGVGMSGSEVGWAHAMWVGRGVHVAHGLGSVKEKTCVCMCVETVEGDALEWEWR